MNAGLKSYHKVCKSLAKEYLEGKKKRIFHVRDKNRRIVATLLAVIKDGIPYIGWSKCNKTDVFNRSVGVVKSYRRLVPLNVAERTVMFMEKGFSVYWGKEESPIPKVVRAALPEFVRRARERMPESVRERLLGAK